MAGLYGVLNTPGGASLISVASGSGDQVICHLAAPAAQAGRVMSVEVLFYGLAAGDNPTVTPVNLTAAGTGGTTCNPTKINQQTDSAMAPQFTGKCATYTTPPTIGTGGVPFSGAGGAASRSYQGDMVMIDAGKLWGVAVNMNGSTTGTVKVQVSITYEE